MFSKSIYSRVSGSEGSCEVINSFMKGGGLDGERSGVPQG